MASPFATASSAADTSSSGRTFLTIGGLAGSYAPLRDHESAMGIQEAWLNATRFIDAALVLNTPKALWCRMRRKRELKITVMGVSVTAGCGASEGSRRCAAYRGWARRTADVYRYLASAAARDGNVLPRAEWHLWPKNAAPVRFWLQCTKSNFDLSNRTDVILVEIEPTLERTEERDLLQLISQLRLGAPNAALGFVMWPSQAQLAQNRHAEKMVRDHSSSQAVDVMSASTLIDAATRAGGAASRFYGDPVHPNPEGHTMLAMLVGKWLFQRLQPDRQCSLVPADAPLASSSKAASFERCYSRADGMPVALAPAESWALRDEGGAKGVAKLGYVSTRPGKDALVLGPLLPDVRCGLFEVSLGYLTSWRHDQGALHLNCSGGCGCMPLHYYRWQKQRDHEPFPLLDTWTRARTARGDPYATLVNASTTAIVRFLLFKNETEPREACHLRVTHVRGEASEVGGPNSPSRVRVDGLSLKLASCQTNCIAMRHAGGARAQLDLLRARCLANAQAGHAGFLVPSCAGSGKLSGCVDVW